MQSIMAGAAWWQEREAAALEEERNGCWGSAHCLFFIQSRTSAPSHGVAHILGGSFYFNKCNLETSAKTCSETCFYGDYKSNQV